ncbi:MULTISPECIES: glycosyltransferase [unclassified Fibrobacter]|uniref:glycosyltransferase n=1 Tax=unclassified Fibrobacter TaxID=2634177 RepID=UPI000D6D053C|nr:MULTISPECIES: glycosyltransferase [unclassified Fibrobacter]PWJ68295.1 glycosyltransferase involved in cell wall biosynthesis [Fibrobacter sp. UWR4]PZW65629.1 glycosyltransferase involved in cell wall biosynthesis [Fibrobacter sp. UWR1]
MVKKVLVIGSVYPRFHEDAEVPWLRASIAHLRKAGMDVQVLAPTYKGLKSHEIDGVKVNRFRYAPKNWEMLTHEEGAPSKMASKPWLQLLAIPYIINGFFQCIKLCRRWKPDVIHAHWPFPHAYIALGAAKLFRIPLVLNFHGAELLLIRKKKWVRPLLKFAIGQAQGIFANSSFTAGKIKALRDVNVEWSPYGTTLGSSASNDELQSTNYKKISERNNIDSSSRHSERSEESSAASIAVHPVNGKFKILFVGRHIERKGICYLIEAAKYLPADKFEIRIVGVGDLTEDLKKQAREIMASDEFITGNEYGGPCEIIFTGKLSPEDLEAEYRNANVFTLPAIVDHKGDTEGLGVVLIEAMELNLPIVASNVGGIPDVVVDGQSGLLVPEKDPEALANAFKRLADEPALVQQLLTGSRKRIAECFSWDGIIQRQIEVYNKVWRKHVKQ